MRKYLNSLIAVTILSALPWMTASASELTGEQTIIAQVALWDLSVVGTLRGGDYGV